MYFLQEEEEEEEEGKDGEGEKEMSAKESSASKKAKDKARDRKEHQKSEELQGSYKGPFGMRYFKYCTHEGDYFAKIFGMPLPIRCRSHIRIRP